MGKLDVACLVAVAVIFGLAGWSVYCTLDIRDQCRAAGGVPGEGVCFDKSVVIPLPQK